jgi:hypothetical protein
MDSRLDVVRNPADPSPRNATVGGNRQKPNVTPSLRAPAAQPPAKVGFAQPEEQVSIDPLRATDRYRLVMPYSLRV